MFFMPVTNLYGLTQSWGGAGAQDKFLVLCYLGTENHVDSDQSINGESLYHLSEQMTWLKDQNYTPVSLDDILAAKSGVRALPSKSVLLTFDTSSESFYSDVYPLLQKLHYPAVLAVVTGRIKKSSIDRKEYASESADNEAINTNDFLTWDQIRTMKKSGQVEIISNTHALDNFISANPQGDEEYAATSLLYDQSSHQYETLANYTDRVEKDAEESERVIQHETGASPRAMAWPYGVYNKTAMEVERRLGMTVALTFNDGYASLSNLTAVPRLVIQNDPDIDSFAEDISRVGHKDSIRVMHVDLDYVYDDDPEQLEHNINAFVARVHAMKVNTVFLQAFADPKGTGIASQTYFPNRVLPMRADLFNRVAWQLKTQDEVKVFAWLPVLSFDLRSEVSPVLEWNPSTGIVAANDKAYHRVSLFDHAARHLIIELYEDLAKQSPIDGVLFHDDAMLSDFEDATPQALTAYQKAGLPGTIAALRADPEVMRKWTDFKIQALIDFTKELTEHMTQFREPLLTVRNIYAPLILNPPSEAWFAQSYKSFLHAYDYTAVEAMPYLENVNDEDAADWLRHLVDAAKDSDKDALQSTIFELQSVDWRKATISDDRRIPTELLAEQMHLLEQHDAMNFGYYPDDFVTNSPNVDLLKNSLSLENE